MKVSPHQRQRRIDELFVICSTDASRLGIPVPTIESCTAAIDRQIAEQEAVPDFVENAVRCKICHSGADRHKDIFVCRANPNHVADTFVGIFTDITWLA